MKAREYTSPLIEKLLSEVTPEEMEKTEQLMEAMNNKQQTAVEWYAGRQHDLEGLRDFGAISIVEYYEELTKAVQQAKEMEKEQIKKAVNFGDERGNIVSYSTAEQYYNETYREGEQC
jgi:molybdenum-dependent DNA-binding transcriptional regulator ModE